MPKMASKLDLGRRLRFRDLQVLCTVADRGSMAKAAAHLGITQPAVSEIIADLERSFGVCLFDRSTRGVEPTIYGRALLRRAQAASDEMQQGVRDIEFLSDPTAGELTIGCPEAIAAILPPMLGTFFQQFPKAVLRVDQTGTRPEHLAALHNRKYDLILGFLPPPHGKVGDDYNVEILFDERLVVAAGMGTRWARRRKIDLAELINEPWTLAAPGTWSYASIAEAFRARGLDMPKISLMSTSAPLRTQLTASGQFLTALSKSVADLYGLKVLQVDLAVQPWRVAVVTLKNRTSSPLVERFIAHVRGFTRSLGPRQSAQR
jgi:DNA-binding transcriptional LysR family regulator